MQNIVKMCKCQWSACDIDLILTSIFVRGNSRFQPPFTMKGGTQIWFRWECAAWTLKPLPIFKDHFDWKNTHFGIILEKKRSNFFTIFGETPKNFWYCGKNGPMFRDIFARNGTMFRDFFWKSDPLEWHIPVCLNMWVPPRHSQNLLHKSCYKVTSIFHAISKDL